MSKELIAISNGIFTLIESDNQDVFYFFRNDGDILGDVDTIVMDFYQNYICKKIMDAEIPGMVMNNICLQRSEDNLAIRLTICEPEE